MPRGIYPRKGIKRGPYKQSHGRTKFRRLLLDRLSEIIRSHYGRQTLRGDDKFLRYFGKTGTQLVTHYTLQAHRKLGFNRTHFGIHWTVKSFHSPQNAQDSFIALSDVVATPISEKPYLSSNEKLGPLYAKLSRLPVEEMVRSALRAISPKKMRGHAIPIENAILLAVNEPINKETRRLLGAILWERGIRASNANSYRYLRAA